MMGGARWLGLCLLAAVLACSDGARPAPDGSAEGTLPQSVIPSAVRDASLSRAPQPEPPSQPPVATVKAGPAPRARSCVVQSDGPLRQQAAELLLTPELGLVLSADRRTLELWDVNAAPRRPLGSQQLERAASKLTLLAHDSQRSTLAWVDERGSVWAQTLEGPRWGKRVRVAEGADRRFAPGLAQGARAVLLAFTSTVDTAMHTFVSRLAAGTASPPVDVTPLGHGAAAPSFVLGAKPLSLVAIDARAGVSPLLEVPFDAHDQPGPAVVRTPVSQPFAPPLLRAVALPGGELEVAFTALGKLAATAIGRVPLRRAVGPVALHPSRGYGELSMSVVLMTGAALFALEVPVSEAPSAPRQLELRWLDRRGEGEPLVLGSSAEPARAPQLVQRAAPGELSLGYLRGSSARVAQLRCDPGQQP